MKTVKDMIREASSGRQRTAWQGIQASIDRGLYSDCLERLGRMVWCDNSDLLTVLRSIGQQIAADDYSAIDANVMKSSSPVSSGPIACAGCGGKLLCPHCEPTDTLTQLVLWSKGER